MSSHGISLIDERGNQLLVTTRSELVYISSFKLSDFVTHNGQSFTVASHSVSGNLSITGDLSLSGSLSLNNLRASGTSPTIGSSSSLFSDIFTTRINSDVNILTIRSCSKTVCQFIGAEGSNPNRIKFYSDLEPDENSSRSIGTTSLFFNAVYAHLLRSNGALSITAANSSGTSSISFKTGTLSDIVTHMTITGSGNIGIGTTSPDTKLHLKGDFTINGDILPKHSNNLGSSSKPFGFCYCSAFEAQGGMIFDIEDSQESIAFLCSYSDTIALFSASNITAYKSIVPSHANALSLGSLSSYFSSIYGYTLYAKNNVSADGGVSAKGVADLSLSGSYSQNPLRVFIGDYTGTTGTTITVNHNLDTTNVVVDVYAGHANSYQKMTYLTARTRISTTPSYYYQVTNANTVTITLGDAPSDSNIEIKVRVMGIIS